MTFMLLEAIKGQVKFLIMWYVLLYIELKNAKPPWMIVKVSLLAAATGSIWQLVF